VQQRGVQCLGCAVAEQAGHATSAAKIALERRRTVLRGMHKCRGVRHLLRRKKKRGRMSLPRERERAEKVGRNGDVQKRRGTRGNKRDLEGIV